MLQLPAIKPAFINDSQMEFHPITLLKIPHWLLNIAQQICKSLTVSLSRSDGWWIHFFVALWSLSKDIFLESVYGFAIVVFRSHTSTASYKNIFGVFPPYALYTILQYYTVLHYTVYYNVEQQGYGVILFLFFTFLHFTCLPSLLCGVWLDSGWSRSSCLSCASITPTVSAWTGPVWPGRRSFCWDRPTATAPSHSTHRLSNMHTSHRHPPY